MKNYFNTQQKKDCNGCGICALMCPKKAITIVQDDEGFYYPVIERKKCINCGICEKNCSNIVGKSHNTIFDTYVAINKNEQVIKESSSGGIFYPLAKYIISKEGIVFGVTYNKELKVQHEYAKKVEELKKFQGSKYVRSDLKDSYIQVKKFLENNKYVLFTGTPCQCYALKKYLKKDYDKLYTCEIVCHANPSPKVFELYKRNIEIIESKKIKDIKFRSKETGWRNQTPIIEFEDGKKIEEGTYFTAFGSELINRPSCHNCKFCGIRREADFTIADFWGIETIRPQYKNNDSGISLLCINTEKGNNLLKNIKNDIALEAVDREVAFSKNRNSNIKPHKKRNKFFREISKGIINENNVIKYMKNYSRVSILTRAVRKIKRMIFK